MTEQPGVDEYPDLPVEVPVGTEEPPEQDGGDSDEVAG